uniref:B3 domain-containing protein Os01g0234100-like isoform X2 n=1 Tax=Erigeron canadensis TaxID=72917 RepID=UPI001CB972F7|nr:B3 domain-containing protein Os01g0234100-like isoform X2 [Erigeron canadensis]
MATEVTVAAAVPAPVKETKSASPDLLQLTFTDTNNKSPLLQEEEEEEDDLDAVIARISPIASAPFTPNPEKRRKLKPAKLKFPSLKKDTTDKNKKLKKVGRPRGTYKRGLGKVKAATKKGDAEVPNSPTMIQAQEVLSSLGNEHPTFIKPMLKTHVVTCFWMGVPLSFCRSHLPKDDSSIVVEDENGKQSTLKFIASKFGLSAGWRGFSIAHKLREGDVLIFQLVEPRKFKIYIVRANDSKEADGAPSILTDEAHKEHTTPEMPNSIPKTKGRKRSSSPSLTMFQKKQKRSKRPTQLSTQAMEHSGVGSEVQGGSPKAILSVEESNTFKDFHIVVNKVCIDSELSEEIRLDYYNLCMERNEILHDGVPDGLFHKLVAGMIGETVSIANALRNCKLTTRKEEFDQWDSSLKSFELIGMKVGFLRSRVRVLATFAIESVGAKQYVEAIKKRNRNEDEIKILETKLEELYESNRKIDEFVGGLKEKAEKDEIEFQKKVEEPW